MHDAVEQGDWLAGLPCERKLLFLSALAHQLTVVGRYSYRPRTEELDRPWQLRSINEVQHRVLACLVQIQKGNAPPGFQESIAALTLNHQDAELRELMRQAWHWAKTLAPE